MMLHDEMLSYTMFCRVILLLYIIVTSYITLLSSMLSIILQYITISFIYDYIYIYLYLHLLEVVSPKGGGTTLTTSKGGFNIQGF